MNVVDTCKLLTHREPVPLEIGLPIMYGIETNISWNLGQRTSWIKITLLTYMDDKFPVNVSLGL